MYTLAMQRTFIARHYLDGGDRGPENIPHAHDYRVEVCLTAPELDQYGYIIDLDVLEPIVDACVEFYRDQLLNDLAEFDQIHPSIEHLARLFHQRFLAQLGPHRCNRVAIRIWENDKAWAAYEETF